MRPERIPAPEGLFADTGYDYAAIAPAGGLVFTAGACPLDRDGRVVASGDYPAQARRAFENLALALAAAGSAPDLVLKTTVYVVAGERADLVAAFEAIAAGFGAVEPPSTLVGVAMLGYPDQLVEIEAVALGAPERSANG
jgi:enamine deaminase RidA (YjgF/YER057c/UK114 family)